eukprot:1188765-Prorocentrum_minimum.AAC.5
MGARDTEDDKNLIISSEIKVRVYFFRAAGKGGQVPLVPLRSAEGLRSAFHDRRYHRGRIIMRVGGKGTKASRSAGHPAG